MAKITKTKYTFEVEHSGPVKDFDDIVLRMSRRVKNYTATVVETKTETVRKPKKVTQQTKDTQTVKKIISECLQEIGLTYVQPNKWWDKQDSKTYTLIARNTYRNPGVEIKVRSPKHVHYSNRVSWIQIDSTKGALEFKRYVGAKDTVATIYLADPNSLTLIKDFLERNYNLL